jgi:hypothetical protein
MAAALIVAPDDRLVRRDRHLQSRCIVPPKNSLGPLRRSILASTCVLLLSGCTVWEDPPAPGPAGARALHGLVRVMRTDGSSMELGDVRVQRDSIVGTPRRNVDARVAIALSDVQRMEVKRVDVAASTWAALLAGVATAYIFLRLAVGGGGS